VSLLPPMFIDAVVAIGNPGSNLITWVGSGFLYGAKEFTEGVEEKPELQQYSLWLVTNNHVAKVLKDPIIRFDTSTSGTPLQVSLKDISLSNEWTYHSNSTLDVAVLRLDFQKLRNLNAQLSFFEEGKSAATLSRLQDLGVREGTGGFILGFPLSLVEDTSGSVIARKSIVARIRNAYANGSRKFLVDGSSFPGNSGGPAIIHPELVVIEGTKPIQNAYLAGIVASYVAYTDVAVSPQTNRPRVVFEENTGLTNVFSVDCIDEAIFQAKHSIVNTPVNPIAID